MNQLYHKYRRQGFHVVGISVEERQDMVAAFCKKYNVDYPVLLDPKGKVAKRYGLLGIPKSLVLNQQGVIMWNQRSGGTINEENRGEIEKKIEATLHP